MNKTVRIIGAGLAGSEAAWQCARRGVAVELFEMRPARSTPAHQTSNFAELVCSNSLKSDTENTAPWLLKEEMRRAGSLLIQVARETSVPAGHALAVDRDAVRRAHVDHEVDAILELDHRVLAGHVRVLEREVARLLAAADDVAVLRHRVTLAVVHERQRGAVRRRGGEAVGAGGRSSRQRRRPR